MGDVSTAVCQKGQAAVFIPCLCHLLTVKSMAKNTDASFSNNIFTAQNNVLTMFCFENIIITGKYVSI